MKTFLLLLLVATSLQPVTAQDELAALDNAQPFYSSIPPDNTAAAEPLIALAANTVNSKATVRFKKGLYNDVTLQVLTPTSEVLVNKEIPAGSVRVQVDLAGFPDGAYTFRVKMGDKTWVKQVTKG
jgi:hypothetical protein